MIRLLLSLWLSDLTVARRVFATLDAGLLHQTNTAESRTTKKVRIGSCKDLSDCSRSHKKWKLFSVFCQELGKLCQLSLTILTYVGRSLNPEKGSQKLWHDRTALFSANIWVNGCGVIGQTLSRQFLTCRNSDQYNPWRCTHLCPVSLNRMCYTICD